MATWGDFITEIPIVKKKGEGIFVKADHVIGLWDERNKLRAEVEQLKGGTGDSQPNESPTVAVTPPASGEETQKAAAEEREACARELEEFARDCPVDPAFQEFARQLLLTAAQRLREKPAPEEQTDFLADVVIPPPAEPVAPEAPPPMAEFVSDEVPPMAEPVGD